MANTRDTKFDDWFSETKKIYYAVLHALVESGAGLSEAQVATAAEITADEAYGALAGLVYEEFVETRGDTYHLTVRFWQRRADTGSIKGVVEGGGDWSMHLGKKVSRELLVNSLLDDLASNWEHYHDPEFKQIFPNKQRIAEHLASWNAFGWAGATEAMALEAYDQVAKEKVAQ